MGDLVEEVAFPLPGGAAALEEVVFRLPVLVATREVVSRFPAGGVAPLANCLLRR